MSSLDERLEANRAAVTALIQAAERSAGSWTTPRAPGKWSPSQLVEHVALSLEEGGNVFAGRPTRFPNLPFFIRPLARGLLFNRVLAKQTFPKAKTNKAMNPASGPAAATDARARLESACDVFEREARARAAKEADVVSSAFGKVAVADYVRFNELHTRHHTKQMPQA